MTLYKLDEWESNGYDDSDWYAVVYNSEADKLERVLTGTTRGVMTSGPVMEKPTEDVFTKAEACLAKIIFSMLKHTDEHDTLEPNEFPVGVEVSLLEDYDVREKTHDKNDCTKCEGTGKWVNPNKKEDVRECFGCKGAGKVERNLRYVRICQKCEAEFAPIKGEPKVCICGSKKNRVKTKRYIAGAVGTALMQRSFGTFYRNGYNKPNRTNTSVLVKFADSENLIPASKLRLARQLLTDTELEKKANELAKHRNFYVPFKTASFRF